MEKLTISETETHEGAVHVILEGEMDINQAERIRLYLLRLVENYKSITLQLQNIAHLDLSFLQLLHSFLQTAQKHNRTIFYKAVIGDDIRVLLDRADLSHLAEPTKIDINGKNNISS